MVPPRVKVLVPVLTKPPPPLTAPPSRTALVPPMVRLSVNVKAFARLSAVVPDRVPPAAVTVPVPSAVLLPSVRLPAASVVPPL
ncbi:hypothetical protein Xcc1_21420 [Xanthomonas campestris pv. campestris]|nr:hypothetical protein Xcc1_21420 [Xanthomonas campestris pv. campestris]